MENKNVVWNQFLSFTKKIEKIMISKIVIMETDSMEIYVSGPQ